MIKLTSSYHTQWSGIFWDKLLSTIQTIIVLNIQTNRSWRPCRTINICNIRAIGPTKAKKTSHKPLFWLFLHKLCWLCKTNYTEHDRYRYQILETIWYYLNMQYQVDPTDQTPENGQKPYFWIFGSFKNAFVTFEWSSTSSMTAKLLIPFSIIIIWTIRQIEATKVYKNDP